MIKFPALDKVKKKIVTLQNRFSLQIHAKTSQNQLLLYVAIHETKSRDQDTLKSFLLLISIWTHCSKLAHSTLSKSQLCPLPLCPPPPGNQVVCRDHRGADGSHHASWTSPSKAGKTWCWRSTRFCQKQPAYLWCNLKIGLVCKHRLLCCRWKWRGLVTGSCRWTSAVTRSISSEMIQPTLLSYRLLPVCTVAELSPPDVSLPLHSGPSCAKRAFCTSNCALASCRTKTTLKAGSPCWPPPSTTATLGSGRLRWKRSNVTLLSVCVGRWKRILSRLIESNLKSWLFLKSWLTNCFNAKFLVGLQKRALVL